MSAAQARGQRALACYWRAEALRTNRLELALAPDHPERRAWRADVAELTGLAGILRAG